MEAKKTPTIYPILFAINWLKWEAVEQFVTAIFQHEYLSIGFLLRSLQLCSCESHSSSRSLFMANIKETVSAAYFWQRFKSKPWYYYYTWGIFSIGLSTFKNISLKHIILIQQHKWDVEASASRNYCNRIIECHLMIYLSATASPAIFFLQLLS